MDSALRKCLFLIIYFDVVVFTTLLCLKKRTRSSSERLIPPRRARSILRPRKIELTQKEELIKGGLQTGKYAYPTFDDIKSDWSDKVEKKEEDNKKSKMSEVNKLTIASTQTNSKVITRTTSVVSSPPSFGDVLKKNDWTC